MNIKRIAMIGLAAMGVLPTLASAAEVRSISREVKSAFDGTPVWTVYIECAGVTEERAIERAQESKKWCAEDLPTMCARQKVKIAKKVCGTHYERLVSEFRVEKAKAEAIASGK